MVLDARKRKHLAAAAIQKKIALGSFAKDKKMKAVVEVAPFEDEETCSGLVFRLGWSGSLLPGISPPCDIVVQEGRDLSASEGDKWDSSADLSSFLQKMLNSTRVKERLENLEEDSLTEHMSRQLGESLVAHNLLLSRVRRAKELLNQEVLQSTELKRRVTGLTQRWRSFKRLTERPRPCCLRNPKRI